MKIRYSLAVFLGYWHGYRSDGTPPYHGVIMPFVWFTNPPRSKRAAWKREKAITAEILGIENSHEEQMIESPADPDSYRIWATQTREQMQILLLERAYVREILRHFYDNHHAWHGLGNEKEDLLHIYAIELALGLKYAAIHADKFPPDDIGSAKRRVDYLTSQENRSIRVILERIKEHGKRLRCSNGQILAAQAHILKIRRAVVNEIILLEHWIETHERLETTRQVPLLADSFGMDAQAS